MKLSKHEMKALGQALSYAVMYGKTEEETAEFAMLKVKIDGEITKQFEFDKIQSEHDKKGCPFMYCDSLPACVGKCKYSQTKV